MGGCGEHYAKEILQKRERHESYGTNMWNIRK